MEETIPHGYMFDLYYDNIETTLDCGIASITVTAMFSEQEREEEKVDAFIEEVGNTVNTSEADTRVDHAMKVPLSSDRDLEATIKVVPVHSPKKKTQVPPRETRCRFYIFSYCSNEKLKPHEKTAMEIMTRIAADEKLKRVQSKCVGELLLKLGSAGEPCSMRKFLRKMDGLYSLDDSSDTIRRAVAYVADSVALLLFNYQRVQSYGVHSKNEVHSSMLKAWAQSLLTAVVMTPVPEKSLTSILKENNVDDWCD